MCWWERSAIDRAAGWDLKQNRTQLRVCGQWHNCGLWSEGQWHGQKSEQPLDHGHYSKSTLGPPQRGGQKSDHRTTNRTHFPTLQGHSMESLLKNHAHHSKEHLLDIRHCLTNLGKKTHIHGPLFLKIGGTRKTNPNPFLATLWGREGSPDVVWLIKNDNADWNPSKGDSMIFSGFKEHLVQTRRIGQLQNTHLEPCVQHKKKHHCCIKFYLQGNTAKQECDFPTFRFVNRSLFQKKGQMQSRVQIPSELRCEKLPILCVQHDFRNERVLRWGKSTDGSDGLRRRDGKTTAWPSPSGNIHAMHLSAPEGMGIRSNSSASFRPGPGLRK